MRVIESVRISSQIRSAALSPRGDLAAIADGDGLILLLDGSDLTRRDAIAIPPGLHDFPASTKLLVCETHLAYLNESTLLVVRVEHLSFPENPDALDARFRTRLLALDLNTTRLVGEFVSNGSVCRVGPLRMEPHHILLSHEGLALACVDTTTWSEVCRLGESPSDHDPGSEIEEEIAPRGIAWHPRRGVAHVLWRYWNGGIVQTYALDSERTRFTSLHRFPVVSGRDEVLEAGGLCLSPDGSQVAAWFSVMDGVIPRDATQVSGIPGQARLGRLVLYAGGTIRSLEIKSDPRRDMCVLPGPVGDGVSSSDLQVGVDFDNFQPTYLDADNLLLNTPGGFLLNIDLRDGRTIILHDFGTPISILDLNRSHRRLLACQEEGTVMLAALA